MTASASAEQPTRTSRRSERSQYDFAAPYSVISSAAGNASGCCRPQPQIAGLSGGYRAITTCTLDDQPFHLSGIKRGECLHHLRERSGCDRFVVLRGVVVLVRFPHKLCGHVQHGFQHAYYLRPPSRLQTWNVGSAASRPAWIRLRSPYSGTRRTALPAAAAGDLGNLKRWQGTRAMSAALSILLGWAVAMTRDVALGDTDIAKTQVRE
jgi:hypothetical protein